MSKTKKENKKLSKEEILEEIKQLSKKANAKSSHQLDLMSNVEIGDEDIDLGFDTSNLNDTADPQTSYRLYYGIRRLLIDNLPKGKHNKKLRQYIYDEKNLFLNRGLEIKDNGIRGSDGKMTYIILFLKEAFDTVASWVSTGANAFEIYNAFYEMNEERGFHKDPQQPNAFDIQLKGLLNTPPPNKNKGNS